MSFLQNRRDRLVFTPPLWAVLRTPRQRVRFSVFHPWAEIDAEVDAGGFLRPTRLSAVEDFCRSEVLEILVIRINLHLVRGSFAVSSPVFKRVDDSEKFFVVDFVIYFRGLELPRVERYWVQAVFSISLR